jgi:hypothetical protein
MHDAGRFLERNRWARNASLALILAITILIFRDSVKGFFVQDDFGWLIDSRFQSLKDAVRCFFRFNPAMTYRPLSQEIIFWTGQSLFGLWPPGFHLFSLFFHLTGGILVYRLLRQFVAALPALLGTTFYLINSAHFTSVYWISALPEPMAMICYVAAILFFIRWDREQKSRYYYLGIPAMGVGMLCKESVLTVPLVLAVYCLLYSRRSLRRTIPFFAVSGAYAICRMTSAAVSSAPYALNFGKEAWHNLLSYIAWSFGFSSTLVLHLKHWSLDAANRYLALALLLLVIAVFLWAKEKRLIIFSISWYCIALQPVLYFSKHIFPYYLAPALAGLALLLAVASAQLMKSLPRTGRLVPAAALIVFGWMCIRSVNFEGRWWNNRSYVARDVLRRMPDLDRQFPKDRIAYIFGFNENDFGVLQHDAAFRCYGYSPWNRFILMGLNGAAVEQIRTLKENGGIKNYYCFLYTDGKFRNVTQEFRSNPDLYLALLPHKSTSTAGLDTSQVRLEPSRLEYTAGEDTLILYVRKFPVKAVDIRYTLNGGPTEIVYSWRLDGTNAARSAIRTDTRRGIYHFIGIRDSEAGEQGEWIKTDVTIKVK